MESIPNLKSNIQNPLMRSLCCAALSPGLRSILLFDSSPVVLQQVAATMASLLKAVTGCEKVIPVKLGTFESEDDLWGHIGLWDELEKQPFKWRSGLLGREDNTKEIRLVIIPDLTKLSLAAARACVVLMGADVAHLERHGQKAHWQPNLCWLAGCSSKEEEMGKVSPHLLDRFALRLNGQIKDNTDRVTQVIQWLNEERLEEEDFSLLFFKERKIEPELKQWLQQAYQYRPEITNQALARILDYNSELELYHRREIALARLSFANAQLEGAKQITVAHVDTAARMMSLKSSKKEDTAAKEYANKVEEKIPEIPSEPIQPEPKISQSQPTESKPSNLLKNVPKQPEPPPIKIEEPVYKSDESKPFPDLPLTAIANLVNPYPEDIVPVEREMASLKLPTRRFRSKAIAHGTIIGVEKATIPQDLALVRTLLEAAKFQKIRQQNTENGRGRLKIFPTDLYRYRRAPVAEQMLMLLLDYTCLQNCKWQEKLFPYLSWAYAERASICLIQVGVAQDYYQFKTNTDNKTGIYPEELKAEKISAPSILVPSISTSLDPEKTKKGRATPLAHGLDLTLQTLRHALQHGRNAIQKAVLVVISDGRGNVPLEASHLGRIQPPVGRKGVEDALQIAEKIGSLDNVEAVLLNPQSKQYPELPLLLAKALGAKVVLIPALETWEVEEWE